MLGDGLPLLLCGSAWDSEECNKQTFEAGLLGDCEDTFVKVEGHSMLYNTVSWLTTVS